MKKVLFSALCVSAMLASCADDELLQNTTPSTGFGEGEKINVTLTATYPEITNEVGTRMEFGEGTSFLWNNDDILGALRIASYAGTISTENTGNTFDTNNPFFPKDLTEPVASADFYSNTAIFAGQYVFYHQYIKNMTGDTQTGASADQFKVTFPAVQEIDPANPMQHLIDDNLWVSPAIKLGGIAYEETNQTAIQFVGLNAILRLTITNNSNDGDLVINKVDVNGVQFKQSGNLDLVSDNKLYTTAALDANLETNPDYAADLATQVEAMKKATVDLLATGSTANGTTISAVIGDEGIKVAKGADTEIYVLIPADQYKVGSTQSGAAAINNITVYTDKGQFVIDAEDARRGVGKEGQEITSATSFNRDAVYNFYPELSGYASDVETYKINNLSDWNNAVAYAEANTNKVIEFDLMTDIKVEKLPSCAVYVTSTASKKLILAEGKTFAPVAGSYFSTIENNGTLQLGQQVYIGSLTNTVKGVINVAATENVQGIATVAYASWAKEYGVSTLANSGKLNINGKVTLGTSSTWTNSAETLTASAGVININAGAAMTVNVATTNSGEIVNAGTISGSAALTNDANGIIEMATATAKVVGTSAVITNNGAITLDAPKDIFVDDDGKATTTALVTNGTTGTTSVAVTPEGVADVPEMQEINSVEMSGAWDVESIGDLNTAFGATAIKAMTWNSVTLDVADFNTELENVTTLNVKGNSSLSNSGSDVKELGLKSDATGTTITVEGNLTVGEDVTVGYQKENMPAITVLGSMTNNGEVNATLTIGAGLPNLNTSATYTNNDGAKTIVASAYSASTYTYAEVMLYGHFVNKADKEDVEAKAITPQVKGTSSITGEYTTK